jgi:hypothetical protein
MTQLCNEPWIRREEAPVGGPVSGIQVSMPTDFKRYVQPHSPYDFSAIAVRITRKPQEN